MAMNNPFDAPAFNMTALTSLNLSGISSSGFAT